METSHMIGLIVTGVITLGFVIGAYYVFRNSALGKLLGNILGDANGLLNWTQKQFEECSKNGLTSQKCSIGPFIIGALVIAGLFGLAKLLGVLGIFKSDEAKKIEDARGGKEITTQEVQESLEEGRNRFEGLKAEGRKLPTDPKDREMAEQVLAIKDFKKKMAESIDSGNIQAQKQVSDAVNEIMSAVQNTSEGKEYQENAEEKDYDPEIRFEE
jgi:hypothetical protein